MGNKINQMQKTGNREIEVKTDMKKTSDGDKENTISDSTPNLEKACRDRIKVVFLRIDRNGNGYIALDEFSLFIDEMGLVLSDNEKKSLFLTIAADTSLGMTYDEFYKYFSEIMVDENTSGNNEAKLRSAFLAADRDGTGTVNFQEFVEYTWEKKRCARVSNVLEVFKQMDKTCDGEVSYEEFSKFVKSQCSASASFGEEVILQEDDSKLDDFQKQLKTVYLETEGKELTEYIQNRWDKFVTFKRLGKWGDVVMEGDHGIVTDVVPGEYSLIDLACYSDLPPLIPKHAVIKDVKWVSGDAPTKSGKAIFPSDFTGIVPVEIATNEYLRYYNCSLADSHQVKISLLYRHGILDFTYENKYLEDYVLNCNGGAGIEKHDFSHIDCPLEDDAGYFILGKFEDDELHLTAFKVPPRYTLYVPGGTIHSNDYLKGTWRTMLSDEAVIDHVHLVKQNPKEKSEDCEHFTFSFSS